MYQVIIAIEWKRIFGQWQVRPEKLNDDDQKETFFYS